MRKTTHRPDWLCTTTKYKLVSHIAVYNTSSDYSVASIVSYRAYSWEVHNAQQVQQARRKRLEAEIQEGGNPLTIFPLPVNV
jgi:hypothetical protein